MRRRSPSPPDDPRDAEPSATADEGEQGTFIGDVAEGLRYVREQRWLLIALLAATVSLLCTWGPWETLVPIVKNDLDGRRWR